MVAFTPPFRADDTREEFVSCRSCAAVVAVGDEARHEDFHDRIGDS